MNKSLHIIGVLFGTTIFWIILNEEIRFTNIVVGIILSVIILSITNKFFLSKPYNQTYKFNILFLIKFYSYLVYKIFASGLQLVPIIIKGEENIAIIDIKTELKNDLYIGLLANAITLTPGTITVEKKEGNLKVLWINCTTRDTKKAGEIIKGDFERLLLKASRLKSSRNFEKVS
ncbi:hypothetical protein SH2C18_22420 [Clostridium sediminicola]|uniref:Na+/H+ antiporter subunit E n=1 Tax=Clostridium sediminicola TaxID=3114879 RepID=UPI0031F24BDA